MSIPKSQVWSTGVFSSFLEGALSTYYKSIFKIINSFLI